MAITISILLAALFSGDPATTPKAAKPKVYVVYVTVVEVNDDGEETVLFTPKVQSTGNPAGVTVDHADGRSFEFNCQLATSSGPVLERPPAALTGRPSSKPASPVAGTAPTQLIPSKPVSASSPLQKPDAVFVRTYDVSNLLEPGDKLTAAEFEPLIQTLKTVAAPESWTGAATIRPFPSTKSLVVKHHAAGHKALAAALNELQPRTIEDTDQGESRSP